MSQKRVVVLGAGLVGHVLVADLLEEESFQVLAADRSAAALGRLPAAPRLTTRSVDLSRGAAVRALLDDADLAVGAVPGFLGGTILEAAIAAGCPLVDISFSPDDPLAWHARAQAAGVPVVVDCGVAPGLSNLLAGREAAAMDDVEAVSILVGGLPVERTWPYEYRFVFSPTDVIEEYTRPCRYREGGAERTVPALSGIEQVEFAGIGTLEAFNTDGLRTLLANLDAPDLREKTLRYPGHAEKMLLLRETGFFRAAPVLVSGQEIPPRLVTEALLGEQLRLGPDELDLTVLRVEVTGRAGGGRHRVIWDLLDRRQPGGTTSMARTTASPCAVVARLMAGGGFTTPGVHPPEILGRDAALTAEILAGLARRGIHPRRREEPLP
jgi:saccharopine dehydrogenase-like NADP-dependent oxidoreductase